jgi:eukaryotic-like serine/threonine-protein kinase
MKKFFEKPRNKKILYWLGGILVFILIMDNLVLPWYVSSPEVKVPTVVGLKEDDAVRTLKDVDLSPIVSDTTYDENFPKGSVIVQKPMTGDVVKKGRRVYIFISGGEPYVTVPILKGRSLKEAKLSLERVGLKVGSVSELPSENPRNVIFDQQFAAGTSIRKGESVGISVSIGVFAEGEITVPDLIGKSLTEAEKLLADSSLKVGKVNFQNSFSLLPNTILDQYPSKGNKVNKGTVVDLFVTKTGNETKIIEE